MIGAFFDRHERVALLFSGGKDSAASLMLCRDYWPRLDVVWVNAGNAYPETIEQMERIRRLVPRFVELKGDQPAFVREHGHPVDVVPVSMTAIGRALWRTEGVRVTSFLNCCSANLWQPAGRFIADAGYTGVIRGDKEADVMKPPIRSGHVADGVEYLLPLEGMSDAAVRELAGELLPEHYARGIDTSLDCRNCTAYLAHNRSRIQELAQRDPATHAEVTEVLRAVAAELAVHGDQLGGL